MPGPTTIGGTITGGIQDISALLPLLGTEQCEKHTGSALDRGFLYSSVTPISIFGSLGIVRASFNILVASFNIQRYQFLGARLLSNSGFSPSGTVAPMIALDPKHPKRFLAETRLEAMLAEEHIDNVPDLVVSWGKGIMRWNVMLVAFTLVISLVGYVPYIGIVLDSGDVNPKHLFPLGFGFPLLRVFGSAICVIVAQFLIQIRILVLLNTRLFFISINRLAKENKIDDLPPNINTVFQRENASDAWDSALAAEKCLWIFQKWLSSSPDTERVEDYSKMVDIYTSQYEQHLGPLNNRIRPCIPLLLCFILAIGCISTVVGYIGCFFLIQHSTNSNGPLLWLVLEAVLSILRILVWATNPSWDDSEGIVFELQLSAHPPMITCNKYMEDILYRGTRVPLTRSNVFLEEAVAYTGPLPNFRNVQDVDLYYILAARRPQWTAAEPYNRKPIYPKCLLIVISAHKERTSRIIFKKDGQDTFSIYVCSLQPVPGTPVISVRVEGKAKPKSHFLTSNSVFMTDLEAHYDEINIKLQNQGSTLERKAFFGKTWAMQRPPMEDNGNQQPEPKQNGCWLTDADKAYLVYANLEQCRHTAYRVFEEWADSCVNDYGAALQDDVLPIVSGASNHEDKAELLLRKYEATEKEYLLIECRAYFERSLIFYTVEWDRTLQTKHSGMVDFIVKYYLNSKKTTQTTMPFSSLIMRHDREIKLRIRFANELEFFLEQEAVARRNNVQTRFSAHWTAKELGIQGPELMNAWKDLAGRLSDTPDYAFWDTDFWNSSNLRHYLNSSPSFRINLHPSNPERPEMLIQNRKKAFEAEVQSRFLEFSLNVKNKFSSDRKRYKIDQMMARCRTRVGQLFKMFAASETDFQHFTGGREFPRTLDIASESFDVSRFEGILRQVSGEWRKKVMESEELLTGSGVVPEEQHEGMHIKTKISDYFGKKL